MAKAELLSATNPLSKDMTAFPDPPFSQGTSFPVLPWEQVKSSLFSQEFVLPQGWGGGEGAVRVSLTASCLPLAASSVHLPTSPGSSWLHLLPHGRPLDCLYFVLALSWTSRVTLREHWFPWASVSLCVAERTGQIGSMQSNCSEGVQPIICFTCWALLVRLRLSKTS